jgi:hypothetical protein
LRIDNQPAFLVLAALLLAGCGSSSTAITTTPPPPSNLIPSLQPYPTPSGTVSTFSAAGSIDLNGIFFQKLGTNARTCASCHQLSQGMALSAAGAQALFTGSSGADPLFLAVDGANCPTAATGDSAAHSLILNNGLIRVAEPLPANAEFKIAVAQDPYGCAVTSSPATGQPMYSVYRRPLPAAGLTFLSSVMWDTRNTPAPLNAAATFSPNLDTDLGAQAAEAVATHQQGGAPLTPAQLSQLAVFEEGLYTAEAADAQAGSLSANGAAGGAAAVAAEAYYPGINDAFGQDPQRKAFNPAVFTIFQSWENSQIAAQASIARGEDIFNTAPLQITNVRGLNDNAALGSPAVIAGTCGTCHDAPNIGTHSLSLPMDIGASRLASSETDAGILAGLEQLTAPVLPVYQITGCNDANNNPAVYVTTDPGAGLFTGLCADINRVQVPALRGLAARAPYFHNGSAASLQQVVQFYDSRFQMNLNPQQQVDLENFLNAL